MIINAFWYEYGAILLSLCNFILDLGKKYGLYDEVKEAKDVNYILNLEDDLSDFFRNKLITTFNIE